MQGIAQNEIQLSHISKKDTLFTTFYNTKHNDILQDALLKINHLMSVMMKSSLYIGDLFIGRDYRGQVIGIV